MRAGADNDGQGTNTAVSARLGDFTHDHILSSLSERSE